MTTYAAGKAAEKRAADYLAGQGYKIRELNWKTRWCEIDIVAEKDGSIFFVEVKYRRNTKQGRGIDYITAKKLKQMEFAAEMWVFRHHWAGEYVLAGLGLNGDDNEFVILA